MMLRLAFTACVLGAMAIAGPQPCSVTQQPTADVITATFTLTGGTFSLTLPTSNYGDGFDNMFLTLETRELHGIPMDPGLRLRVGSESVAIQNGAVLHVRLKPLERLVFSVIRNGEAQCTWEPYLRSGDQRTQKKIAAGNVVTAFRRNEIFIHPVRDPVVLVLFHDVEQAPREFKLGGLPATVLAETSVYIILRDPQPAIGTRTVETRGESSLLHFAEIEKEG